MSVLCDDKQMIQQQNYREKCKEDDSFVDICLSGCRSIISSEEKEKEREREARHSTWTDLTCSSELV